MSIEYLGLSSINGPLIALEGVQDAFYDEIVEFVINGTERKIGRIVEIYEDRAVIQVFEGSENMSLKNTHTKLTGHPWRSPFPRICWDVPSTGSASPSMTWGRLSPH